MKTFKKVSIILMSICLVMCFSNYLTIQTQALSKKPVTKNVIEWGFKYGKTIGKYTGKITNNKPNGYGTWVYNTDKTTTKIYGTWVNGIFRKGKSVYTSIGVDDNNNAETDMLIETYSNDSQGYMHGNYQNDFYVNGFLTIRENFCYNHGYKNGDCYTSYYAEDGKTIKNTYCQYFINGVRYYTTSEFNQIYVGMDKSSVEFILGEGKLDSSTSLPTNSVYDIYSWGDYDTGYITISFEDGKVERMSQVGLINR